MKPGERVRVIKEAAESLTSRSETEAKLILGQFGFQDATWNVLGTVSNYISCIEDGDDEALTTLHEYLLGEDADPAPAPQDQPWGDQPIRLFISHVHEDALFVGNMKRVMAARFGIDAFVAHDDIHPSKQWRSVIRAGLASCDALLALTHPRFHKSQWCDQEVGWALGRKVPVIPVRPADFDRSTGGNDGFLEEHQDLTLAQPPNEWHVAQRVLPVLLGDPRTHEKAFTAAVESFVNSGGFNHTRWIWPFIAREPSISSDSLRRLEFAVQTNHQVYDANYERTAVPELVKALVEKHEPPDPWSDSPPWEVDSDSFPDIPPY